MNEQIEAIRAKIPKGWGSWISCGPGWYDIIIELDKQLTYLIPTYEPHQIKEKFGGLRFYWGVSEASLDIDPIVGGIAEACVDAAEAEAWKTCEVCGAKQHRAGAGIKHDSTVKLRGGSWYRTLCDTCAIADGYEIEEDDE